MKRLALVVLWFAASALAGPAPPPVVAREVAQLFTALEQSGCDFQRNGSWHTAAEASAHLRRKYDYLLKKGLVTSSERFIQLAASRSSLSGQPYHVRCGDAAPVESSTWFGRRLVEIRARAGALAH
ncbi:hypothetical protein N800_02800 [Lysobacter daejeonensis GH1-9]|uniref:DUF5329 domain-containing protein n=1 Tax=Lysobacter daejeonensis GH1-9 TaxID=1385517 RepID=A0A0A0EU30_9GAMM|nr:DUF5329 domain-containing protein [Lysobacter daejeonensis]KGM54396.1 hypothetical protein N800_02800 [Lysobacter daejeonensis GH1-9]